MASEQEIFEQLKQRKRSFDIDGVTHWVVEGDLVLNETRLRAYARAQAGPTGEKKPGLVAMERDGKLLRWAPGKVLTYGVQRATFRDDASYQRAIRDVRLASGDWAAVCNVRFEYDASFDGLPEIPASAVVFRVRQVQGGGSTIASAFFPDWPADERWVNLYDMYFDPRLTFDPTGVLRHELGHVLGFRHEHIRIEAPMDCPDEADADTRALTAYDDKSVMHYFCGGKGNAKLTITDVDKQGAQDLYGRPLADFEFVD
jgi:hypothetical protein